MRSRTTLALVLLAVAIAATGCLHNRTAATEPPDGATWSAATAPAASGGNGAGEPAGVRREPVLLDETTVVINEAKEQYTLGEEAYRSGEYDRARRHFDAAVLKIMTSGLSLEGNARLSEAFARITQDIQSLEADALAAGDERGPEDEESPVEELKDITQFLSPEELAQEMSKIRPPSETDDFSIPVVLNDRVLTFIEHFQTRFRKPFAGGYERMGRYEAMIRRTLREEGLPEDLIYLSFIESTFKPHAYSRARAKGIWQFMSSTGSRYGLDRNAYLDERSDPEKATRAAARYLKDLHAMFGDWYLAMAAYNSGEGVIQRAIERTGKRDFWDLARTRWLLPETKNFVPSILALSIMSRDPARYGHPGLRKEEPWTFDRVTVDGPTDLGLIARLTGSSLQEIRDLNPQLPRSITPPGYRSYTLRVPRGSGEIFQSAYAALPSSEKVAVVSHSYRVRRGDTLSRVARRFGTSVASLADANGLSTRARLSAGMSLIVPGGVERVERVGRGEGAGTARVDGRYVVRPGDTLSTIARRHRTSADRIATLSGIRVTSTLRVGQVLQVRAAAPAPGTPSRAPSIAAVETPSGTSDPAGSGAADSGAQRVAYKVRRGDNLYRIARKYGTTVESLRSWNGLIASPTIRPGDVLTIYLN